VSKRASARAKKDNRLVKAGYKTKKGVFSLKKKNRRSRRRSRRKSRRRRQRGGVVTPELWVTDTIKKIETNVVAALWHSNPGWSDPPMLPKKAQEIIAERVKNKMTGLKTDLETLRNDESSTTKLYSQYDAIILILTDKIDNM